MEFKLTYLSIISIFLNKIRNKKSISFFLPAKKNLTFPQLDLSCLYVKSIHPSIRFFRSSHLCHPPSYNDNKPTLWEPLT